MARPPKEVTDAELAILESLWTRESASVRQLANILYPGGGVSEVATVHKLCERLLAKGFVARDTTVRPALMSAAIDRNCLIGSHLKSVADKLCSGSFTPLLTQLVESADLSKDELQQLRSLVAGLDPMKGQPERKKK